MEGFERHRVLALTRYDRLGPSSRVRFLQFLPALAASGLEIDVQPFFGNDYIRALYSGQKTSLATIMAAYGRRMSTLLSRKRYDLIWLEKEALPWMPSVIETALLGGVPYAVDLDDAWFHRYDLHPSALLRSLLGGKVDVLMRNASVVIAGNDYLAARARQAGAKRIEVIPSVIDLDRYPSESEIESEIPPANAPVIVGWIGTPVTAPYLASIEPAFRAVAGETGAILQIVGAEAPAIFDGLKTNSVAWSEETEIQRIGEIDIGIMPLANTPWEQGKCAYKLLQIMAAGRPVTASPVGANCKIVQQGNNGFLANSTEEWISALRQLISDAALRRRFGIMARQTVKRGYSTQTALPLLASALKAAACGSV